MFKIALASLMLAGLCLQAQAQGFGNDVRHGPCVTGMGTPGDKQECWTFAFSRLQEELPQNPGKAKYFDNWDWVLGNETAVRQYWLGGLKDIISNCEYIKQPVTGLSTRAPFTRLCVPNSYGLKKCGLKSYDWQVHFNPKGYAFDKNGTLFYKAFLRKDKVVLGIGRSRH